MLDTKTPTMFPVRVAIEAAVVAFAIMLAGLLPASNAHADEIDELTAQADQVSLQISEKQAELDQAGAAYEEAVKRQSDAMAEKEAALTRKSQVEAEILDIQARLNARAEKMYKDGNVTFIDLLFDAESFEDLLVKFDAMQRLNDNDARLIHEERQLREEAQQQADYARQKEVEAAEQAALADEIRSDAEVKIAELQAIYDGLNDEVARILQERQEAEAQAQNAAWQAQYEAEYAASVVAAYEGGYFYDEPDTSTYSAYPTSWGTAPADANDIVARAYAALGSSYVWGGVGGADGGYDCSGLVSYAYTGSNTRIGTTNTFMGYTQVSDPQPGDIVTNSGHCGIYIGNGQMIHASDYGTGVVIGNVQDGMIAVRPD